MFFKNFIIVFFISLKSFSIILDPIEMNLRDPDQRATNIIVAKIQVALRDQMMSPVIIQNSKRNLSQGLQDSIAHLPADHSASTVSAAIDASFLWKINDSAPMDKCLVMLAPSGLLSYGIARQAVLTHEAFHCFQFQMAGSMTAATQRPAWVVEGSAMFVEEDLIPETSQLGVNNFQNYTRVVTNIFNRNYDAYPFFLHLQQDGANVYQLFHLFFVGGSDNLKIWQDIVHNVPHHALMTWAASFAYKPEWGSDWDLKIRDYYPRSLDPLDRVLTAFPKTRITTDILPLVADGEIGLPRHDEIILTPDKFVKLSVENGMAAIFYRTENNPNGQTYYLDENQTIQFCYGPNCDCPETIGAVHTIKVSDPMIFMASVSSMQNHIVHFDEGLKTCCNNEGGFDSRMVGTWESPGTDYLQLWGAYPYSGGLKENTGSGKIEFIIGRHGEIIKRYRDLHFFSRVTKGHDISSIDFTMKNEVSGCMTTRSTGENKGWIFITDLVDQVEWFSITQQRQDVAPKLKHVHGEWFQASLCVGPGTTQDSCKGTYQFESDILRFNGGSGNGVYRDMIRVR